MSNAIYRNLDGSIGQDITDLGNSFVSATISGGIITFGGTLMSVDTEGSAVVDELVTIANGGTGKLLLLRNQSLTRRVILKHNTGNLWSASGDVLLDDPNKLVMLIYNGSKWVIMGNDGTGSDLSLPADACALYYNDLNGTVVGMASLALPSALRPFGYWSPNEGGASASSGGRLGSNVLTSSSVLMPDPIGTQNECTVIIDYGVEAPCSIGRVRFWYRGAGTVGEDVKVLLRFFDGDGVQIGTTNTLYEGNIIFTWTQATWSGSVSGVRYVVMTHMAHALGSTYIGDMEIN